MAPGMSLTFCSSVVVSATSQRMTGESRTAFLFMQSYDEKPGSSRPPSAFLSKARLVPDPDVGE